ncbi:abortive infection bacteriophage resistance protein [Chitinophaga dinghuensis]|uniref:Abortive infection bacteriophage resistance protein n=1 Tax=Chitinophaga dinghuensis TaxID=1539050 RepID=A0A327VKY2_9BACT|nr:Abi family protein [Chitinophaga dinghuensis]RAJ75152.1 abortive infection bacteriophage resistance protein [Chitinophaga dinghuensis]
MTLTYNKPALSIQQQIILLQQRGVIFSDQSEAIHFLENVGYYRLAGYWQDFQTDRINHIFCTGTNFKQIIELYNFDRELRLLLIDAIERIEVSFRCRLSNMMSIPYSPTWFAHSHLFHKEDLFDTVLEIIDNELARSGEKFILHHDKIYGTDRYPPAWKTLEVLSFGTLSKLYGNIRNDIAEKKAIAKSYGLSTVEYLHSWIQAISVLRNICSHHGRLCYRIFGYPPKLMHKGSLPWIVRENMPSSTSPHIQFLFLQLCTVRYILHTASPQANFHTKLKELIVNYPSIDVDKMGFSKGWEEEALWK